jgi:Predicted solute binding protein
MAIQRDLKAFVRYDGSGRVVAGSLILRKNKPKVGRWQEIPAYECCNYIPTTTTTTTASPTTTTTSSSTSTTTSTSTSTSTTTSTSTSTSTTTTTTTAAP